MNELPGLRKHEDGLTRCEWPGIDPLYIRYHDEEWGIPERDDRLLFAKLILDGFQAGLSWITILRKRAAFYAAFDNFAPERIARYDQAKIAALMRNPGLVRNRAKIEATIGNARAWLKIQEARGFSTYLWGFVDGEPIQNHFRQPAECPAQTTISRALAKDLKQRGFRFCGPTISYAFMQAVGMVNDHLVSCNRHEACAALARRDNTARARSS
ncbi:MAG: DNA-3-methyladenine glycosylase I [Hyphomicrobiales bacterium]